MGHVFASLSRKVILVTGASSGIGRALATILAQQGAHVALIARNETKLRELEHQLALLPGRRLVLPADVRLPADVGRCVATVLHEFGRIDVLVNNAGKGFCGRIEETPLQDLQDVMATNFVASFLFLQAVIPHMTRQRSGLIIQMSSLNGFSAVPLGSAYCASKFALEALSESARMELKRYHVHVLVVRPGVTDTSFFDNAKNFRAQNPFPMNRFMSPDEVARKTLRAAVRHRRELVLTIEGKLLWWLKKLCPHLVERILVQYVKARPATSPGDGRANQS
jgi:dehydrogenase/reductase SDR family protein 7B